MTTAIFVAGLTWYVGSAARAFLHTFSRVMITCMFTNVQRLHVRVAHTLLRKTPSIVAGLRATSMALLLLLFCLAGVHLRAALRAPPVLVPFSG